MQYATNVFGSMTLPGPTGGAYDTDGISRFWKKVIQMLRRRFVHVGKSLTHANFGLLIAPKCVYPMGEL